MTSDRLSEFVTRGLSSVWFQNRRAKFRKQERLNQQKSGSGQTSGSSNSNSSQNGSNGSNGSANNGSAGGNNQSSSNLESAANGSQHSTQKPDSTASAVAQQLHQQNTPSAKEIKTNPEKTMNVNKYFGLVFGKRQDNNHLRHLRVSSLWMTLMETNGFTSKLY
ncbi:unnamed protein product [Medioppia subpectinata]|uniref:Homeobox domain-containing protein n=1 Tax=Medioppia subpectinata TaxID=1979941 RepID=A0A7R9KF40_9ACAR|nr:unnamed protein product [Medioppia subpectinata]CAG2102186.1 unnamed protein product [Medioppia subpectinata]